MSLACQMEIHVICRYFVLIVISCTHTYKWDCALFLALVIVWGLWCTLALNYLITASNLKLLQKVSSRIIVAPILFLEEQVDVILKGFNLNPLYTIIKGLQGLNQIKWVLLRIKVEHINIHRGTQKNELVKDTPDREILRILLVMTWGSDVLVRHVV